ncbi:hypothetical protein L596_020417 [Steinernema carpocapsae]|uniref:Uncharacterized protein n=1 Tax=Steinernema carpocapsae TaxID=34508 RepID=A0A4U5MTH2_STECR|nr:hypothetical protein L596_020417 [Steinernema carpocapsae]
MRDSDTSLNTFVQTRPTTATTTATATPLGDILSDTIQSVKHLQNLQNHEKSRLKLQNSKTPKMAKNHPILHVSPRLSPNFSQRFENPATALLHTNGVAGLFDGGVQTCVASHVARRQAGGNLGDSDTSWNKA